LKYLAKKMVEGDWTKMQNIWGALRGMYDMGKGHGRGPLGGNRKGNQ